MENLKDYFKPFNCKPIKKYLNIETVEELQAVTDKDLLKIKSIGPAFIKKLRAIQTGVPVPSDIDKRYVNVVVHGLSIRQRNALITAFNDGRINTVVNAYLPHEGDQLSGLPIVDKDIFIHEGKVIVAY
jgi:hypothetical protein